MRKNQITLVIGLLIGFIAFGALFGIGPLKGLYKCTNTKVDQEKSIERENKSHYQRSMERQYSNSTVFVPQKPRDTK